MAKPSARRLATARVPCKCGHSLADAPARRADGDRPPSIVDRHSRSLISSPAFSISRVRRSVMSPRSARRAAWSSGGPPRRAEHFDVEGTAQPCGQPCSRGDHDDPARLRARHSSPRHRQRGRIAGISNLAANLAACPALSTSDPLASTKVRGVLPGSRPPRAAADRAQTPTSTGPTNGSLVPGHASHRFRTSTS